MNIYAISAAINLMVAVFVGGMIWRKSQNRRLANTFGAFSLSVAVWSLGYLFWQLSGSTGEALFWVRFFMMGAIFTPITFLHFTLTFLKKEKSYRTLLYGGYTILTLFALGNFTDYFVVGVEQILAFNFWPEPGVLFHPFLALWLFYAVFAVYLLYNAYKSAESDTKIQITYIFIGTVIGYAGAATNYFLWYNIKIPPIGTIGSSIYLGSVAYAVVKHQLFNIKVILAEFFSWLLLSILVINLFLSSSSQAFIKNLVILIGVGISVLFFVRSVYREVKSREKAEELAAELQEVNQELKYMDQQKSKMLSIASHQFRSPLTSIEGYASMMKKGTYGEVPEHLEKPINRIFKSSTQLSHIVDDFLNISRIEQGRMEYDFQEASVKDIVADVVDEIKPTANEEGLELAMTTDGADDYTAEVDVDKFTQVITNLVDNAIKYTQEGSIEARVSREEDTITVAVEDSGIGIDPEDQDAIFEQFSRADEAKEADVVGSGLGLYIAKQIIEAHDGEIWAESEGEGEGSTFFVQIKTDKKDRHQNHEREVMNKEQA